MEDPTYEHMIDYLNGCWSFCRPLEPMDVEEAIYAFASDFHTGQWSNLYSALSTSEFKPGPMWDGLNPDTMAGEFYASLLHRFGGAE